MTYNQDQQRGGQQRGGGGQGRGGYNQNNMNQQFRGMNVNSNAFNPSAQTFVPGGGYAGGGGTRGGYGAGGYNPYGGGGAPGYGMANSGGGNFGGNYGAHPQGGYNQAGYHQQQQGYNQYNNQAQQQAKPGQGMAGAYAQQPYASSNNYDNQPFNSNWRQPSQTAQQTSPNNPTPPQHTHQPPQQVSQPEPDDDWDTEPTPVETPAAPEPTVCPTGPVEPEVTQQPADEHHNHVDKPNIEESAKTKENLQPTSQPSAGDSGPSRSEKKDPQEDKKEKKNTQSLAKVTMKADKITGKLRKSNKEHLNVVFIGHVDAGKSTIGGQIMNLTGMVDKRTLEKFEREAKEKNRESWYLSWALDTNLEERDKGKTVETGRAYFETEKKHFTILDAPGHKSFVPSMISGAAQADVAVLVISARKGEFEAGFEQGGQTREHAMLVKTAGVKKLIVAVNKMDERTVMWSEDRWNEIRKKLEPYLKKVGFNPKKDIHWIPISGQTGINMIEPSPKDHPFYTGLPLIKYLDDLPKMKRKTKDPVRMPVAGTYSEMGVICIGKLESGTITKGQTYTMMPNKQMIKIGQIKVDEKEVDQALAGENVEVKIQGVEEEEIGKGFVICDNNSLCHYSDTFDAKVHIQDIKSIMAPGYQSIIHIHTLTEECSIKNIIAMVEKKTGKLQKFAKGQPKCLRNGNMAIVRIKIPSGSICIERFKDFDRMGRLTLRDEGKTIAMGTIMKVVQAGE